MGARIKNMEGLRFGRLMVKRFSHMKPTSQAGLHVAMWVCDCDCGTVGCIVGGVEMRHLKTKSCGCLKREALENGRSKDCKRGTTHGLSGSLSYGCWANMIARCSNPNSPGKSLYIDKGISVCERWKKFENFHKDMGDRPSIRHSLDRWPNNKGNYEPGNVRWATAKEQTRNTSSNRIVEFDGDRRCVSEWAEIVGINQRTLLRRLNLGWQVGDAMNKASKKEIHPPH